MMRFVLFFFVFYLCVLSVSYAQDDHYGLIIDMPEDHVDIATDFDGTSITVYGVKPKEGQVAVVIRGPKKDVVVRKKDSLFGVWMNIESHVFKGIPDFYDFALSDLEDNILTPEKRREFGIGFAALGYGGDNDEKKVPGGYREGLVRNMQEMGFYSVRAKDIFFLSDTFFKTSFFLPSNVLTGDYIIETYLINGDEITSRRDMTVRIAKIGFADGVHAFAHSYSFGYAIVIVIIAAFSGWLSNAVRR